jgi:hypothetical protein
MSRQLELRATHCWDSLVALLKATMQDAQVDAITDRDFDDGDLVLSPPSVRVMFDTTTDSVIESSSTGYESVHHFLVICGDEDRRSAHDQARASLKLAEIARHILAGARLRLETGERTEPLTLVGNVPIPVKVLGVAYGLGVEVQGPSSFPGANANPSAYEGAPDA